MDAYFVMLLGGILTYKSTLRCRLRRMPRIHLIEMRLTTTPFP